MAKPGRCVDLGSIPDLFKVSEGVGPARLSLLKAYAFLLRCGENSTQEGASIIMKTHQSGRNR
jgi:hypothetical protein